MPHPKHELVRAYWQGRCGYCGVSEQDAGGDLTIDHFIPIVAGGDDDDDNLVYACFRCNSFKGEFWPAAHDLADGQFVLHPLRDDLSRHLRLDEASGLLKPLTETGRFHIELLHLNRPALVAYRIRRLFHELLRERKELVDAENRELRAIIDAQRKYIEHLRRMVQGQ